MHRIRVYVAEHEYDQLLSIPELSDTDCDALLRVLITRVEAAEAMLATRGILVSSTSDSLRKRH